WVIYVGYALLSAAVLLVLYERAVYDALPDTVRTRLPRTNLAGSVAMMGIWAFAIIGLVHVARYLHTRPHAPASMHMIEGGVLLMIAMLTCGLVGFALERMAYKPLRKAPRLNVLITAIGVSLLLQNAGQTPWMFGTKPEGMPKLLRDSVLNQIEV